MSASLFGEFCILAIQCGGMAGAVNLKDKDMLLSPEKVMKIFLALTTLQHGIWLHVLQTKPQLWQLLALLAFDFGFVQFMFMEELFPDDFVETALALATILFTSFALFCCQDTVNFSFHISIWFSIIAGIFCWLIHNPASLQEKAGLVAGTIGSVCVLLWQCHKEKTRP